jgi:hypothetical protein
MRPSSDIKETWTAEFRRIVIGRQNRPARGRGLTKAVETASALQAHRLMHLVPSREMMRCWLRPSTLAAQPEQRPLSTLHPKNANSPSALARNAGVVLGGIVLGWVALANIYRAVTQGIVYDEAATYLIFMAGPLEHVFTWYTANNHVLFTLLADASTGIFGVSEFTLRLPSVLAGTGYLCVAALLARRICVDRRSCILTFCALALNPLVFDFLSAARGYGLALFLFTLALLELSRDAGTQRWVLASVALGGAICANLTFAFPAAALWIAASAVALRVESPPASLRVLILRFWLPGAVGAAAFLAVPLRNVTLANFFFGAESLIETATSLSALSIRHHPTWWTETSVSSWIEGALTGVAVLTVIAMAGMSLAAVARCWRASFAACRAATRHQLLLGGTLTLTIALMVAAHLSAGVLYPKERTGLFLIVMAILSLGGLVGWSRHRVVRWGALATLLVLTLTSIEQFTLRSYGQWRYDAGSRRIAEIIASRSDQQGRAIHVAATQFLYQPALEFYRVTRFRDRMAAVVDGFDPARANQFDVLVVDDADAARAMGWWQEIYVDPVSGAHVLAPSRSSQQAHSDGPLPGTSSPNLNESAAIWK